MTLVSIGGMLTRRQPRPVFGYSLQRMLTRDSSAFEVFLERVSRSWSVTRTRSEGPLDRWTTGGVRIVPPHLNGSPSKNAPAPNNCPSTCKGHRMLYLGSGWTFGWKTGAIRQRNAVASCCRTSLNTPEADTSLISHLPRSSAFREHLYAAGQIKL
jgi:hypothetical protein